MKITAPIAAVRLFETEPGDLIRLSRSTGPVLALVLIANERSRVLAILDYGPMDAPAPFHLLVDRDAWCAKFTTDWCLELVLSEDSAASIRKFAVSGGAIHIGATGTTINVINHPKDHQNSEFTVNLATFEFDDVQQGAIPFPHWRIWQAQEDIVRADAIPIFEFRAQPSN